ncbi:MAG: leucine-rich repeat domain-containing protein [Oscillospiraceae bacterium]|jgi:hypothetical protein
MMKKALKRLILLLLVLVFMLGAVPQAAALTMPEFKIDITDKFTDANFLAAVREKLGKGAADKVYTTDVSKITVLSVSGKGIASLDGIEYFYGLERFLCYNNNLTSLDVSKNPNLDYLHCSNNQLTALDVSKNPNLEYLFCEGVQLTSLDVSKNPNLNYLQCSNNQLTALDVSKNPNLNHLSCQNNYLPSENAIIGLNKSQLSYFVFAPQAPTPSAPQNLSAKPGDAAVTLSWALPAYGGTGTITSFEVTSNNGATWITAGNTSSYTFTGLKNGQSYTFKVRAVNSNGKGLEAEILSTPEALKEPFYQSASDWAVPELEKAFDAGLVPEILKGLDMKKSISREEFAELAVQLYETATGKIILVTGVNPFTDTTNYRILKAYQVGITTGTSATTFSPHMLITREQCATMLYRAIKAILPNADYSTAGIPDFPDQEHIASWAVEETKYMAKLGIILGNEKGYFMPKPLNAAHEASGYGMASREAAVLMTIRTFEKAK